MQLAQFVERLADEMVMVLGIILVPVRRTKMLRLRLTHCTYQTFGSKIIRHIWVGQQWNPMTEYWEDRTNKYPTAKEAELALLRTIVDVELESTFECFRIKF